MAEFIARAKPFGNLTKGPFHGFIDYICNFDWSWVKSDSNFLRASNGDS